MIECFESRILVASGATAIHRSEVIQSLWSGYGEIVRLYLDGGEQSTLIAKAIFLPDEVLHPRGWNTNISHQRKIHSYEVEMQWYHRLAKQCDVDCRVAQCYLAEGDTQQSLILLEDLDHSGFPLRKSQLSFDELKPCLSWLANFHARFMGVKADDLWPIGSYWHLATRPDELQAMADGPLKQHAVKINAQLNSGRFQTLIHGDAKVANFCFSSNNQAVAAVDFQYVGHGCGMRDLAYLMGSSLSEQQCEVESERVLDYYFSLLSEGLLIRGIDSAEVEAEWRALYPLAWADFERFLLGWMPSHHKINRYSKRMVNTVLGQL